MNRFVNWLNTNLTPKVNKISKNVWISSIQNAIMMALPMIFVGSLVAVLNLIGNVWSGMPDLTPINTFSFGLFSIFIAFLLPYQVMDKKKLSKKKLIAGFTSIGLFMMMLKIDFTPEGALFDFNRFGAAGMLVAIIAGVVTAVVMNLCSKFSLFKEDTALPDIVVSWFDNMIPIAITLFIGYIFMYVLGLDIFAIVIDIFSPITKIAQTLPGFVLVCFIPVLLYSLGISSWIITPITFTICLGAIAANTEAVAAGGVATNITTFEVIFCGWVNFGGQGATLPLVVMMLFSKSTRLKAVGRATIVPSIFNINEPVVFGTPIAWNPTLMIPMWLNAIIVPIIVYVTLDAGLVSIPDKLFAMYSLPLPISTWMVVPEIAALVLFAVVVVVMCLIWYPFFKAYEIQCVKEENETKEEVNA